MKSNTLELKDLCVARDGQILIHGLTYRLQGGDVLLVKGRNGAGKSSLLKTIAGLLPIAGGEILVNGEALYRESLIQPLFLGHKRGNAPSMSVGENVRLWAKASGNPETYAMAMHYFDLEDLADIPVQSLSAGWQQRVALTRLITIPSPIWLLDEPTSNLDDQAIALLHALMETRAEQGGIVLLSSHIDLRGDKVKTLNISDIAGNLEVMH